MQRESSLWTVPSQFPKLWRAGRVEFHTSYIQLFTWFGSSSDLGQENFLGTWLMAESRLDFQKGPLLVSLQNSEAYGFVSKQFTAPDVPAKSKRSSCCSKGKISANLNSDNAVKFGWTFLLKLHSIYHMRRREHKLSMWLQSYSSQIGS